MFNKYYADKELSEKSIYTIPDKALLTLRKIILLNISNDRLIEF